MDCPLNIILCCIVFFYIIHFVLASTVLSSTVLSSTILTSTILASTVLYVSVTSVPPCDGWGRGGLEEGCHQLPEEVFLPIKDESSRTAHGVFLLLNSWLYLVAIFPFISYIKSRLTELLIFCILFILSIKS